MNTIKIIIGSLFLLLGVGSAKAQTKTWTLQDCIQYAIDHNIDIKQQELDLEEAKIATSNAKGAFLPNLNASIRNTWSSGLTEIPSTGAVIDQQNRISTYGVSSNIPIYNGLKNYNSLQRAKLQEIANQFNIDTMKDDIKLNVANSYLQVLLQKENITILKNQYKVTLKQLEQAGEMVKAGNLPEGEVLLLQATAASDLQRIAEAENSYEISKLGLKRLLNLDLMNSMQLKKEEYRIEELEILERPMEDILENVLKTRNEIKLSEANLDVAKKGISVAKGDYMPNLSGFLNFNTNEQKESQSSFLDQLENNRGIGFGFNLSIPIFNRFQIKNGVKRSKINLQKRENELKQTKQRVTQDVYQAYLNAKATYKTYLANQKTVEAQKLAFEYQQTRFDVGQSNLFDYTQSKVQYLNSETELLRVKYNLLFRLKILELYYNPIQ